MLSKPNAGWTTVTIGSFSDKIKDWIDERVMQYGIPQSGSGLARSFQ
jgi:hypothetical protein